MLPMDRAAKHAFIRSIAERNPGDLQGSYILWSRHATVELVTEGWARQVVEQALAQGEIIEDYPVQHRPLPDCLVLSQLPNGQILHAVIALDSSVEKLFVVTVYCPSNEEWENDWRTRK